MKQRRPLTKIQNKVLNFIVSYQEQRGRPPTRKEINLHFGWSSVNNAGQHLRLMERKGYLRLIDNISRGIEIL